MRLRHTCDLANSTIQQDRLLEKLAPNEFVMLHNFVADKGALVGRPSFETLSTRIFGGSVQGLYSWRTGTNTGWILAAVAEYSTDTTVFNYDKTKMVAFMVDFSQDNVATVRKTVVSSYKTLKKGQSYCFVEYRGAVYVSNGFQTAKFDGERWTGWNNRGLTSASAPWETCGQEIAFKTACVFADRLVIGNTPHYPNEVTWPSIYADVGMDTKWTGNAEIGSFADTGIVTSLNLVDFYGGRGLIGGEEGAFASTNNFGGLWRQRDLPSDTSYPEVISLSADNDWVVFRTPNGGHAGYYSNDNRTWNLIESANFPKCLNNKSMGLWMASDTVGIAFIVWGSMFGHGVYSVTTADGWTTSLDDNDYHGVSAGNATYNFHYVDADVHYIGAAFYGSALVSRLTGENVKDWHVYYTTSGTAWTQNSASDSWTTQMNAIATYANNPAHAVVVGNDGLIKYRKANTDAFTAATSTTATPDLFDVIWLKENLVIAVGENGYYVTSSDNMATWTATQIEGVNASLRKITHEQGKLIAVGDGGIVVTSDNDGASWTVDEPGKNVFTEAFYLAPGEEVRALLPLHGQLYMFTNQNAYAYDSQFGQRSVTLGLSALNHNCVKEYAGAIWVFGHYNGKPGVYAWDGQSAPVCMSKGMQDYVDDMTVEPSPKMLEYKFDTDEEFTRKEGGLWYEANEFRVDEGVLKLNKGQIGTHYVWSHGSTDGGTDSTDTAGTDGPLESTGFYVPDMALATGTFGWLNIEMALNEDSSDANPTTMCQVYARVAPNSALATVDGQLLPDSTKWTTWQELNPSGKTPFTGQGAVYGRFSYNLDHTQFTGYNASNEPYKWFQFRIQGKNTNDYPTNWAINRISFRPEINLASDTAATIFSPAMATWDDKLYVTLPYRTTTDDVVDYYYIAVYSNRGRSLTTMTENRANAITTYNDKLLIGSRTPNGKYPLIAYTVDTEDWQGFTSTIRTGRLGFDATDPTLRHRRKILRRIYVAGKPISQSTASATVTWWADGRSNDSSSKVVAFSPTHDPDLSVPQYQIHEIEVHSAPASPRTAGGSINMGHEFTVQVQSFTDAGLALEHLAVEVDVVEPTDGTHETAAEA